MSSLQFFEAQLSLPGGTPLSVRSTLVSLQNGSKILISPIKFNEGQIQLLKQIKPTCILAPNCFHHLFVKKTAEALSITNLLAAPGLQEKRADISWTETLSEETWPHHVELEMIFVGGAPKYNECVFLHKASKTLIVTDLLFNLKNLPGGFSTLIYRVMGTLNKTACSRLLNILMKDKIIFQKDIHRILEWDFDNIVMAHGEIIQGNGKEVFITALKNRNLI